ncbi:hypothetical protein Q4I32_002133 [Leishmania shawi]|uniref:Uncharacterized protein n=1 Tax=Leishmania shawi TaxID=5680 RepID=A0AAW3C3T4_9TRYP
MQNVYHRKIDEHFDHIEGYLRRMVRPPRTRCDPLSLNQAPHPAFLLVNATHDDGSSYRTTNEQLGLRGSMAYNVPLSYAGLLSTATNTLAAPPPTRDPTAVRAVAAHYVAPTPPLLPRPLGTPPVLFAGTQPSTSLSKRPPRAQAKAVPPHSTALLSSRTKHTSLSQQETRRLHCRGSSNSSSSSTSSTMFKKGAMSMPNSTTASSALLPAVHSPPPLPLSSLQSAAAAHDQPAAVAIQRRIYDSRSPSLLTYSQDESQGRSMEFILEDLEERLEHSPSLLRSQQQQYFGRHTGSNRHHREGAVHTSSDLVTATSSPTAEDQLSPLHSSLGDSPYPYDTPLSRRLRHFDYLLGDSAVYDDGTSAPQFWYHHNGIQACESACGSNEQRVTRDHDPPTAEASSTERQRHPVDSRAGTGTPSVLPTRHPASTSSVLFADLHSGELRPHQTDPARLKEARPLTFTPRVPSSQHAPVPVLRAAVHSCSAEARTSPPPPPPAVSHLKWAAAKTLRLDVAAGADTPTPARRDAEDGASHGSRSNDLSLNNSGAGHLALPVELSVDASRMCKSSGASDASEGPLGSEGHRDAHRANATVSQNVGGDVPATQCAFHPTDLHNSPALFSEPQREQSSVRSASTELTALTLASIGGFSVPPSGGSAYMNSEEDVNGGRCLATLLWARRQNTQAAEQLRTLRRRERQHRQSVVKREVEGRYSIRLCEASDAADTGLEGLQGADENTVTATSFTLSSSPSRLVGQLPHLIGDGRRRVTSESLSHESSADGAAAADVSQCGSLGRSGRTLLSSRSNRTVVDGTEQPGTSKRACLVGGEVRASVSPIEIVGGVTVLTSTSEAVAAAAAHLCAALSTAAAEMYNSPAGSPIDAPGVAACEADTPGGTPPPAATTVQVSEEHTLQQEADSHKHGDYAATADLAAKPTAVAMEDAPPPPPSFDKPSTPHLKGRLSGSTEAAPDTPVDETVQEAVPASPGRTDALSDAHIADTSTSPPPLPPPPEGQSSLPSDFWTLDKGDNEGGSDGDEEAMMAAAEGDRRSGGNEEYAGSTHANGGNGSPGCSISSSTGVFPTRATVTAADDNAQPSSSSGGSKRKRRSTSSASSSSDEFIVRRIPVQVHPSPSTSTGICSTDTERAADGMGHVDAAASAAFTLMPVSSAAEADNTAEHPPVTGTGVEHAQAKADAALVVNLKVERGSDGGVENSRNGAGDDAYEDSPAHSTDAVELVKVLGVREHGVIVDESSKNDEDVPRPSHMVLQPAKPSLPPYATACASTDGPVPASGAATAMTTSSSIVTTTKPLAKGHEARYGTASRSPESAFVTVRPHLGEEQPLPRRNEHAMSSSGASSESFFYSLPDQGVVGAARSDETPEYLQRQADTTGEITSPVARRTEVTPAPYAPYQRSWEQPLIDGDAGPMTTGLSYLGEAWHSSRSPDAGGRIRHDGDAQSYSMRGDACGSTRGSRDLAGEAAHHSTAAPKGPAVSWTIPLDGAGSQDETGYQGLATAQDGARVSVNTSHHHQRTRRRAPHHRLPPHLRPGRLWAHLLTRGLRTVFYSTSSSSRSNESRDGGSRAPAAKHVTGPSEAACGDASSRANSLDASSSSTSSLGAALSAAPRRTGPWYATPARRVKKGHHVAPVDLAKAASWQPRRSVRSGCATHTAEEVRKVEEEARPGAGRQARHALRESASSDATATRSAAARSRTPTTVMYAASGRHRPADFALSPSSVRTRTLADSTAVATYITPERLLQPRQQRQPVGPTYVQLHEQGRALRLRASVVVWRSTTATEAITAGGMRTRQSPSTSSPEGACCGGAASLRSAVVWRLIGAPRPRSTEERCVLQQQGQWESPLVLAPHAVATHRSPVLSQHPPHCLSAPDLRGGVRGNASLSAPPGAVPQEENPAESPGISSAVRAQSPLSLSGTPPSPSTLSVPPPPTVATAPRHTPTSLSMKDAAGVGAENCKLLTVRDSAASTAHSFGLTFDMTPSMYGTPSSTAAATAGGEGVIQDRDEIEQGEENNGENSLGTNSDADSTRPLRVSAPTPPPPQPLLGASRQSTLSDVTPTAASTVVDAQHHDEAKTIQLGPTLPGDTPERSPQSQPLSPAPHALGPLQAALSEEGEAHAAEFVESRTGSGDAAQHLSQQGPAVSFSSDVRNASATGVDVRYQPEASNTPLPQPAQFAPQPAPTVGPTVRTAEPRAVPARPRSDNSRITPLPPEQQRREALERRIARLEVGLQQQQRRAEQPRFRDISDGNGDSVPADNFEAAVDGDEDIVCGAGGGNAELRSHSSQFPQPRGRSRCGSVDGEGRSAVAFNRRKRVASRQVQRGVQPVLQARYQLPASASTIHWAARSRASGSARGTGPIHRRGDLPGAAAPTTPRGGNGIRGGVAVALPAPEAISASAASGASAALYMRLAYRQYGLAATPAVAMPAARGYSHATTSFLIGADWRYQRIYVDTMYFPASAVDSAPQRAEGASGAPEAPANDESERITPAGAVRHAPSANSCNADVFACRALH